MNSLLRSYRYHSFSIPVESEWPPGKFVEKLAGAVSNELDARNPKVLKQNGHTIRFQGPYNLLSLRPHLTGISSGTITLSAGSNRVEVGVELDLKGVVIAYTGVLVGIGMIIAVFVNLDGTHLSAVEFVQVCCFFGLSSLVPAFIWRYAPISSVKHLIRTAARHAGGKAKVD